MSGLERGGELRFLTLTSSKDSPPTCQHSFRLLYSRLKRRGLIQGYIKVPQLSRNGKQHLHVIFRGSYIPQITLSNEWNEIHKAKIIDIRRIKNVKNKKLLAGDMAKYMARNNFFRYSWSWGWVWRGFVKDWCKLKRLWRALQEQPNAPDFQKLLLMWRWWLKGVWKPDFTPIFHKLRDEYWIPKWVTELETGGNS